MMAKLCSPARDDEIEAVRRVDEIVPLFRWVTVAAVDSLAGYCRALFTTLDNMKLDMANYTITSMRPKFKQVSAKYEREKFDAFLKITPSEFLLVSATCQDLQTASTPWTRGCRRRSSARPTCRRRRRRPPPRPRTSVPPSTTSRRPRAHDVSSSKRSPVSLSTIDCSSSRCPRCVDEIGRARNAQTLVMDAARLESLHAGCTIVVITATTLLLACAAAGRDVADVTLFKEAVVHHALTVLKANQPQV